MYLDQLLEFTYELGNKHRTVLTKKSQFLVKLSQFWVGRPPANVTADLKTILTFYTITI